MRIRGWVCLLLLLSANGVFSQRICGISYDEIGNIVYYAYGKTIECQNIESKKVLFYKKLSDDSVLLKQIAKKACLLFKIKEVDAKQELRKTIKELKIINVTFKNLKVYVGIGFNSRLTENSTVIYGIIALSKNLKPTNFYLFPNTSSKEVMTLTPYCELEFVSPDKIVLPLLLNGDVLISKYYLNKNNEARRSDTIRRIKIPATKKIANPQKILLSPLIFPITNSGYSVFYQYPYPVVYGAIKAIDPYNKKQLIDSLNTVRSKSSEASNWINPFRLNFSTDHHGFFPSILSTYKIGDTIKMLVLKDNEQIEIISISRTGMNIRPLREHIPDSYYLLRRNFLLLLKSESDKWILERIDT
ncbi:MAG TPA: hypothetical protein VD905_19730 [Flavobacteriales bacterium]|nr:hypothetical protein [Flavobacteriales bacterium]